MSRDRNSFGFFSVFFLLFLLLLVAGCGKNDTDGDGVPNDQDWCPTLHHRGVSDRDRPGCPVVPALVRRIPADASLPSGLDPEADGDGDGVLNKDDWCPTVRAGETPDSDRLGCPTIFQEEYPDAGTGASTDPDAGTGASTDSDAGTGASTDSDAGTGASTDPVETLTGLSVGQFVEAVGGRDLANHFCWATSEAVRRANAATPDAPCGYGEVGCWRRASAAVTLPLPARGTTGTFGCLANSPLRWRCGVEVVPCNPATAAVAWRLHTPATPRRNRR